jgi:hypothetical protein
MDTLSFISSLIGSLSWPIAIIVLVLVFRKPLSKIIEGVHLKRIKRGDFEIDFDRELSELKNRVKEIQVPEHNRGNLSLVNEIKIPSAADDQIELISQINPSAAIALAWSNVEKELQSTILRIAISPDYPLYNSALKNIQLLKESNCIDANTFNVLNKLRQLRNEAVHSMYDSRMTVADVEEYNQLAKIILEKLKSLKK